MRLAVLFFGGLLAIVCIAGWIAVGPEVRSRVTPYQQATVVLFAIGAAGIGWSLVRCRVTATETGLEVVNGLRTHRYEWAQVLAVHMPPGAPFPTLDLADGTSRFTLGIQASDGDRAKVAVRQLRRLLARTSEESFQRRDPPADG